MKKHKNKLSKAKFIVWDCYCGETLGEFVRKHNAEKFKNKQLEWRNLDRGIIVQEKI